MSRTTVVVGAGITGLAAARRLAVETDDTVIVCEAAPRIGGKLHRLSDPLPLDVGAESILARRPEALELITELGLQDQRVHPTDARAQAYLDGACRPLPASNMGVPNDPEALTGYLSPDAVHRVRSEGARGAAPLTGDVAIGSYVADRFGDEVTDRLLEPMLGGVYAGDSRSLSFEAVHPSLYAEARNGGSLLAAAQRATRARQRAADAERPQPVFAGLVGGVAGLVDALAGDLARRGATVRTDSTVRKLISTPTGYELITGPVPRPQTIIADRVLLALPAAPAARLLRPLSEPAADLAGGIPYASMAVISFVLADTELSGSGLLVPPGELPTIKAFTYSHNKWQWIADRAAERFGPGTAVVRASVGRYGEEELLQVDDQQLIRRTVAEARRLPGWADARVLDAQVQRWGGGLPQYLVGHRQRIADLRAAVADLSAIAVAGAYLDGLGIPACIAGGYAAVEALAG